MWANIRTGASATMTSILRHARARALKDPKQVVNADSLQASTTRSDQQRPQGQGVRGAGGVLSCHEENATQLITDVEVTVSSGSFTDVSVPVVDGLAERRSASDELLPTRRMGLGPHGHLRIDFPKETGGTFARRRG